MLNAGRMRYVRVVAAVGLFVGLLTSAPGVNAKGTTPVILLRVVPLTTSLHVGQVVWFQVAAIDKTRNIPYGYYVDFKPEGAWGKPWSTTTNGDPGCGGDHNPGRVSRESGGYWNLDFGDCTVMNMGLVPTKVGPHGLLMRVFWVPVRHDGQMAFNRRVEEKGHRYFWRGIVGK